MKTVAFSIFLAIVSAQYNKNEQFESCFTQERTPGQCISIRLCPTLADLLLKRPFPPEYAEYLKKAHCGFEGLDAKVCCPLNTQQTSTRPTQPTQKHVLVSVTSPLLPDTSICGTDASLNKLLGGDVADLFEFPWMALLEYQRPDGSAFYCGGVLINEKYVLTAAHCIIGKNLPKNWKLSNVVLGEYNTETKRDCVNTSYGVACSNDPVYVPVVEKIPHEYYDPFDKSQQHDIALLRLARSVEYSDFIKPICLPTTKELLGETFVGTNATVSGWGKTETKSESKIKLKLKLPVKSNRECQQVYTSERVTLSNGHICAGGMKGKDSCTGDSGGPLMNYVALNDVNWYVTGIVSFGPASCGLEGWPGIYTRVTEYVPWIVRNMRQ